MREYLFRGKQEHHKVWVYGHYFTEVGRGIGGSDDTTIHFIKDKFGTHPVLPETVGQFTGLTDKNGVKIFEGDIIAGDSEDMPNIIVEWSNDHLGYFVGLGQDTCQDPLHDVVFLEVIGNIHDDPELI